MTKRKFDLIDNRNAAHSSLTHNRTVIGNPRALYNQRRIQHFVLRMSPLFERYTRMRQLLTIPIPYRTAVGNEYIISTCFRQERRTRSAFTCTQYGNSFAHLSFSVAKVKIASSIPTIQKRVTIFAS